MASPATPGGLFFRRETIVLTGEDRTLYETWLAEIEAYLQAVAPPDLPAALSR